MPHSGNVMFFWGGTFDHHMAYHHGDPAATPSLTTCAVQGLHCAVFGALALILWFRRKRHYQELCSHSQGDSKLNGSLTFVVRRGGSSAAEDSGPSSPEPPSSPLFADDSAAFWEDGDVQQIEVHENVAGAMHGVSSEAPGCSARCFDSSRSAHSNGTEC